MYIECKVGELTGAAQMGRVTFSKTGAGQDFKSNYTPNLEGRVTTSPTLNTAVSRTRRELRKVGLVVTRPSRFLDFVAKGQHARRPAIVTASSAA